MRILGPDGNPLPSSSGSSDPSTPPIAPEVQEIVDRAKAIAAQGDPVTALQQMKFAFQYDVVSDAVLNATCDLLGDIARMQGVAESEELQLFQALRENRDDAIAYYTLGDRFFQLQQPFISHPFLRRAAELLKDVPVAQTTEPELLQLKQAIDVDIAQVLMDLGGYEEGIAAFHALNDTYGGLPIWLLLEMAECYALLRQMDEAEAVYQIAPPEAASQFPGMEDVREEVGDLLARVRDFDGVEELGLREWHYVQTRGILLETNPDENIPGERFVFFQPTEEDTAYIVGVAAAMLDARGLAPNKILWIGPNSEPLARLFAQWWEVDESSLRPYAVGDNTDDDDNLALLVMAHSYDVMNLPDEEAFVDLAQARAGLVTFALDLRWTERQAMVPDIAGFQSQICNLPWETRLQFDEQGQPVGQIEETRTPQVVAEEIAAQFPEEEELDRYAKELSEDYDACTDLILDHRDGTLIRRPLVTHSPIKSPQLA